MKVNGWKVAVHAAAWLLAGWLLFDYFTGDLTVNPIQAVTQRLGKYALFFLVASLACTPLNTVFGLRQAISVRRLLGLYAFLFAALHFGVFIGLDYRLDIPLLLEDIGLKRYVLVGLGALTILTALAITSFRWWMKRLGKNWKRLHRLVYLAGILVIIHYAWAVKGDIFRLQGDIWQPLVFGVIVMFLLVLRIPIVRRAIRPARFPTPGRLKLLFRGGKSRPEQPAIDQK